MFCVLCCWSVRYPRVRAEIPSKVRAQMEQRKGIFQGREKRMRHKNPWKQRKGCLELRGEFNKLEGSGGWEVRRSGKQSERTRIGENREET